MSSMTKLLPIIALAACTTAAQLRPVPRPGFPVYDGTVAVEPNTQRVSARWSIAFVPDSSTARSVTLLLNRGLQVSSVTGAAIAAHEVVDSGGFNRIMLRFAPAVAPGQRVDFEIAYAGTPVFGSDSINGIRRDWIELGLDAFWHPVFAGFNQNIVARARLEEPDGWDVVASGSITSENDVVINNRIPLIDVAFAAAPAVHEKTLGAATVYHVSADSATVQRVLNATAACGAYLNQRYAEREALPHAKIVLAPRQGP